jgi:hypothetical protein
MFRFEKCVAVGFVLGALAACGKKQEPAPAKPANGAPMAFQVTKVVPGEAFHSELDVRAYNFSDRTIASYWVLVRYKDSGGNIVHGPHEATDRDFDHWSFSGNKYACAPSTWCTWKLDPPIPSTAKDAEIVAYSLSAVQSDGVHVEKQPVFKLPAMALPR